ncbi:unnamed protein product [Parajaminaea phylloscopi]
MEGYLGAPPSVPGGQPSLSTYAPPGPKVDGRARGGNRKRGGGGKSSAAGKAKKSAEGTAAADASKTARKADSGSATKTRGRGRAPRGAGGGRGRGRGRGGAKAGSAASPSARGRGSKARDSTARRSASELRGSTTQRDRSPTAGGAVGDDGLLEPGVATSKARRDYDDDDEDAPEEDDEDAEGGLLEDLGEEEMKWREEMERLRGQAMGPLIMAMSTEQYDRHESYRRSGFTRSALRRLINLHLSGGYSNSSANPTVTMAFGGVAKVFVGEIVEGARRIRREREGYEGDEVPLTPDEILESYRVYSQSHGEAGALARGRGNPESVMSQMGVGDGTGRRKRLF